MALVSLYKLSAFATTVSILIKILESESEVVIDWFEKNKMVENPDKFQAIIIDKRKTDHTYERIIEPSRHLSKHINHVFTWKILCHVSKKTDIRKNLEAIFIALLKPCLNEQKNFERLILFRNGIT